MHRPPFIVSIQVGRPRELDAGGSGRADGPWTSAIFKAPVDGRVPVGTLGLDGDAQADPINHGGPDKAVCAYSADHYDGWRDVLSAGPLEPGAFGENLTVAGLSERDVCIGDIWAVGDAVLQISQPRQPCWKLGRKWRLEQLPRLVLESGRTGWYFRVVRRGSLWSGASLTLQERLAPSWTIAAANDVMHGKPFNPARGRELMGLERLSSAWKDSLRRKVDAARRDTV
jgi:MOSC domain-containing protein YiiM